MNMEDMILVSVDDHIIEPPDVFEKHLPAKYREDAPRLVTKDDGTIAWFYNGVEAPSFALGTSAGRPKSDLGLDPVGYDDMRPGCYDVHERVRDMNVNGQLAASCFPTFPGYAGRFFAANPDPEIALVTLQAYNDWNVDEWCGAYPARFIPIGLPPSWDVQACAAEVKRLAAKGCHAISFTENPEALGYPSFHSDHWDPFWAACSDEGTIVTIHIGSSGKLLIPQQGAPIDVNMSLTAMNIFTCAAELLWSQVFRKFPTLKVVLAEGGTGWIPYFLERMDRHFKQQHEWTGQDFGGKWPSEVFREHFVTCFVNDDLGVQLRHLIGIENITWEADFPHGDGDWPRGPEGLYESLLAWSVPDDEIELITHKNMMRLFQFDPFSSMPREECTVGALRAQATDVDLTTRAKHPCKIKGNAGVDMAQYIKQWQNRHGGAAEPASAGASSRSV